MTANLANHWARKGWEITIVTLAPESNVYPLHPAIRQTTLNMAGSSPNMAYGLAQNFRRARALRRAIDAFRPDIAIAVMSTACVTLAAAAMGLTNTVSIGSIRSHPESRPTKPVWKALELIALGQLHAVVAQTQTTAAWLAAHSNARRIEVIPNPIRLPLLESGPRIKPDEFLKDNQKVLLAAGRLVPEKGFDFLVQAYALIAGKYQDWDLAIVGDGPERENLQLQIGSLGMCSRIHMPGWVGNTGDWYQRANLYVMTSRFEGFPNTLVEAMAYGLPAVSFDCDAGPRDIIRNEQDGLLVPAEDVAALADALDRLIFDDDLRKRFAVQAKQNWERFTIETISQMWESLFADLSAAKPALAAK